MHTNKGLDSKSFWPHTHAHTHKRVNSPCVVIIYTPPVIAAHFSFSYTVTEFEPNCAYTCKKQWYSFYREYPLIASKFKKKKKTLFTLRTHTHYDKIKNIFNDLFVYLFNKKISEEKMFSL